MIKTHFGKRCIERGIESVNGDDLGIEIYKHVSGQVKSSRIERVGVYSGSVFYRFVLNEGSFYTPIAPSGWPTTVYTQEMFRRQRRKRKHISKARSHKDYRGERRP